MFDLSLYVSEQTLRLGLRIALVGAAYLVARYLLKRWAAKYHKAHQLDRDRIRGMVGTVHRVIGLTSIFVLLVVLGVEATDITAFLGTTFTLVGVAFFASWSILSNVTASLVLFLHHRDLHLGDRIRILEGDNTVEGTIVEFGTFALVLRTAEGAKVLYPNNLAIVRPIVRLGGDPTYATTMGVPAVTPHPPS